VAKREDRSGDSEGSGASTEASGRTGHGETSGPNVDMDRLAIGRRMASIGHKIVVLSGKGGVGKSTVAVNLAVQLAVAGKRVGLLDIDIHGPSVPKLLGLEGKRPGAAPTGISPVKAGPNLVVMSIGFMLSSDQAPIIWRGPLKMGAIKQFLKDVEWGELDYLIVDSPPGTGDEPLSIIQLIGQADGAIIVTTPQELALSDVRKCITFCRRLGLGVLGVVENMSWLTCPHCGKRIDVFKTGGGRKMALEMGVPFLASIPLEPEIVDRSDRGQPLLTGESATPAGQAFGNIVERILSLDSRSPMERAGTSGDDGRRRQASGGGAGPGHGAPCDSEEENMIPRSDETLRIAVPIADGKLSAHFGHCETFALVDVVGGEIRGTEMKTGPPHEPGALPRWLHENGANIIIAGGMGQRARAIFAQNGIEVVVGAPSLPPHDLVSQYLSGTLATGENICDH